MAKEFENFASLKGYVSQYTGVEPLIITDFHRYKDGWTGERKGIVVLRGKTIAHFFVQKDKILVEKV